MSEQLSVVTAMLKAGVTAEEVQKFVFAHGLQDEQFVQDVIRQLQPEHKQNWPTWPEQTWTIEEADGLLNMLA